MKELNIAKLHFTAFKRNVRPLNKLHRQLSAKYDRLIEREAPEKEQRAVERQLAQIDKFYDAVSDLGVKYESFGVFNPSM